MTTTTTKSVRFDDDSMWLDLRDGRSRSVPLTWFPRLLNAAPHERNQFEISRKGMHWEALDEDVSIAGLLAGRGYQTRGALEAA